MPKKKMHFILLLASVFAMLLLLSGCVEEVVVNADELKRPDASVRFIQADESQGTTTISIYGRLEDANKVVATITVDYANASQYYTIPAGARRVRIQSALLDEERTVTFTSFFQTSLILYNGNFTNSYERYIYSDEGFKLDEGKGTKGAIRFRNLLSAPVYCGIDYDYWFPSSAAHAAGAATGYYAQTSGAHFFEIFTASDDIAAFDIDVAGNTRYTIAAFGTVSNPIIKVFTDDGK